MKINQCPMVQASLINLNYPVPDVTFRSYKCKLTNPLNYGLVLLMYINQSSKLRIGSINVN